MKRPDERDLVARDRACVMHPYASPLATGPLYAVERAQGARIVLDDGRELVDGMSSWWAVIHGYNHPVLNDAIATQLSRTSHVMFGGLTHAPAVRLAERLIPLTPSGLTRVFFSDSGSVSVEVAIKLALQYWQARGRPEKRRLLAPRGGYHGDTLGAMAVCDPINGMHALFQGLLTPHVFVDRPGPAFHAPWQEDSLQDLERGLVAHANELAAVILEPIVQGAGGMRFYHPEYLSRVRTLCDRHDVLLIADEIATGFGRTGKLFACEHAGITPDILCVGKALTGGMLTLAATLCTEALAETIAGAPPSAFMHGPTFMANPLACAVALASIDLLLSSPWQARVGAIEEQLASELSACAELPSVSDVRVLGAIGVVELAQPVVMERVQPALVAQGVWLRPFGRLLYTMPPYIVSQSELSKITAAMRSVARGIAEGDLG